MVNNYLAKVINSLGTKLDSLETKLEAHIVTGIPFERLLDAYLPGDPAIPFKWGRSYITRVSDPKLLCEFAKIDNETLIDLVKVHSKRFNIRSVLLFLPIGVIYSSSFIIIGQGVFILFRSYFDVILRVSFALYLSVLVIYFLILIILLLNIIRIGARAATVLVDRHFADSVCAIWILHLIIDLNQDTPITPRKKSVLLRRINHLAKMTRLLSSVYPGQNNNEAWITRHFKEMELFIRERQRWLVAPMDNTLAELRQDFGQLVPIYITGSYGNFTWHNLVKPEPEQPAPTWKERLVGVLPRFFGIILPLTLMGLYIWRPQLFPFITLSPDVVTLILIAWLLLAIDATLNLGIVAGLTSLAKGIKDLK